MPMITPPEQNNDSSKPRVFLAGSIDLGKAEDWQLQIANLIDSINSEIIVCNPRRSGGFTAENTYKDPAFKEQVFWELSNINDADLVIFYFCEQSISPVSLLELGMVAADPNKNLIVYCLLPRRLFPAR